MRLAWARFDSIVKFDNGTSSDEASAAIHGVIEWDSEAQVISIGNLCFPLAHVRAFIKAPGDPCATCGEQFSSVTATAAHARFAHGILGKKAQKAKESQ